MIRSSDETAWIMLVTLLGGIEHLGGSCLRTDLIELQFRIAGDKVPAATRGALADLFRGLLADGEALGLVSALEEPIGARLSLTAVGRSLVGYAVLSNPVNAAQIASSPTDLAVLGRIAAEGVSAVPVDRRRPGPRTHL